MLKRISGVNLLLVALCLVSFSDGKEKILVIYWDKKECDWVNKSVVDSEDGCSAAKPTSLKGENSSKYICVDTAEWIRKKQTPYDLTFCGGCQSNMLDHKKKECNDGLTIGFEQENYKYLMQTHANLIIV